MLGKNVLLVLYGLLKESLLLHIESCTHELGLESGAVEDDLITASSSYDPTNVGPHNARLRSDVQGGAWCPRQPVTRETNDQYLQVDLGDNYVISSVLTQGRYAGGQGQEYTQAYTIQYWRMGMSDMKEYRDSIGKTVLAGNTDTYTVVVNTLDPPIICSKIRILPFSNHSRTVCLRLGLKGCKFNEGLLSYNIPQGRVRGSTLELIDHNYDGIEDHVTGNLRNGLGQLTDGKYGSNIFRPSPIDDGRMKGYEWVGWKNKSAAPLQMDFTFDQPRIFSKMIIHANNLTSKDIQIFSRAKVYFSNEEGKFGDDRAVDVYTEPLDNLEGGVEARNVTIDLEGEHGSYLMVHLYFASKWILISEITFVSEVYEEKPFPVQRDDGAALPSTIRAISLDGNGPMLATPPPSPSPPPLNTENASIRNYPPNSGHSDSRYAGPIIGALVTLISILVAGIFFVMYRGRQGKDTPSHSSLLSTKIQDKLAASIDFKDMTSSYTPYKAKMRVYGHIPVTEEDGNLYSNPINCAAYSVSFPSLQKKCSSDTVLSEDYSDDYAEPQMKVNPVNSASMSENLYSQALPTVEQQQLQPQLTFAPVQQQLSSHGQINHYAKPLNSGSPGLTSSPDSQPFLAYSPPKRFSPPRRQPSPPSFSTPRRQQSPPNTLNLQHVYEVGGAAGRRTTGVARNRSVSHLEVYSPVCPMREGTISPSQSSLSSVDRMYARPRQELALYSKIKKSPQPSPALGALHKPGSLQHTTHRSGSAVAMASMTVSDVGPRKPSLNNRSSCDLNPSLGNRTCDSKKASNLQDLNRNLTQVPLSEPKLIARSMLKIVERIGRGQFGDVHLCHYFQGSSLTHSSSASDHHPSSPSTLVAVKSLETNCSPVVRASFQTEAQILSTINDPNIGRVVGANFHTQPNFMVCEYSEQGDLNQYLQDHVAETSLSYSSGVNTLRFGSLIYMATQIASGMKYLESINFIHRDLATRNCLVYPKYGIKISDSGSVRTVYNCDYFTSLEGGRLPIRWMSWESIVLGKYTTKSDVWSFGVTFWEILTFAREQPFEELSDEKVVENVSNVYDKGKLQHSLSHPYNCPRDIFDLISECWAKLETERPSFREIHLFLQRKNLGFSPEDE